MLRRRDVSRPEQMVDMTAFEPAATEVVPAAYYLPPVAAGAVAMLRAHGIEVTEVTRAVKGVERFTIDNVRRQSFQQHDMRFLEGRWEAAPDLTVARGSWAVPMNQPLARLAFYLLEPASDDGLTAWNVFDNQLEDARTHPVLRRR